VAVTWGDVSEVPWVEATTIGSEDAHATWALAARMRLEEVARDYHAVIGYAELADWVQRRSRVRTRQQPGQWMPDVLFRTMQDNRERREPFLASLCVDASGRVLSNYPGCVQYLRGAEPADADRHAAEERLACYRWFGAELPEGGGEPGPMPSARPVRRTPAEGGTARAARDRSARDRSGAPTQRTARPRVARTDVVPAICPRCYMALPASGQCDSCD
jgi:hypothetical protein